MNSEINPELFEIDDENNWKTHLDNEGYVVLKNILSDDDIFTYMQLFMYDWKFVSPNFSFTDKSTWIPDNCPMIWNKGMIYSSGFGQSDFQWELRTNSRIISIWEKVHNTTELVVSFDGFSVFLSKTQSSPSWLHIDQNPKNEIYSIQGAFNFFEVSSHSAGFIVVPKSHKYYKPDVDEKKQYIPLDECDINNILAKKLIIPANCFILWNSKTIHANIGMNKNKQDTLDRLTSYITFFPKKDRSQEVFEKRMEGYIKGDNCGHYATMYHPKKHPYGLKKRYESRGFNHIVGRIDENGIIPENRMKLI